MKSRERLAEASACWPEIACNSTFQMWKCPPLFPRLHQPSASNNYWQVVLVYAILPRLAVPRSVVHRLTGRGYSLVIEAKSVDSCPIWKASITTKIVKFHELVSENAQIHKRRFCLALHGCENNTIK